METAIEKDNGIIFLFTRRTNGDIVRVAHQKINPHEALLNSTFINRNIGEEIELNRMGSYCPEGKITGFILRDDDKNFDPKGYDFAGIINHLTENPSQRPLFDFSLRDLAFADECGWKSNGNLDELQTFLEEHQESALYKDYQAFQSASEMKMPCEITAVENNMGVIIFDNSGYGRRCEQSYLNQLAERYFDPEFALMGPVKRYHLFTEHRTMIGLSRKSHRNMNPYFQRYDPGMAIHTRRPIMDGVEPYSRSEIGASYSSFDQFLSRNNVELSPRLNDLRYLTLIADDRYDSHYREYYEKEYNPPSAHTFKGIDERFKYMDNLHPSDNPVREGLIQEAAAIAKHILKSKYQARGYTQNHEQARKKIKQHKR